MNPQKRRMLFGTIISLAMILTGAWAWGYLADERDAATAASQELAACRELAVRIVAIRVNSPAATRPADLSSAIAQAAKDSGLPDGSLDRIDPGAAPSNNRTEEAEAKIDLTIRQATLKEVMAFARAVSIRPMNLRVSRLALTPSTEAGGGWAVSMTLTYPLTGDLTE